MTRTLVGSDGVLINPANNHPNGGGYAVMAQRLVADLKVLQPLAVARTALVHR